MQRTPAIVIGIAVIVLAAILAFLFFSQSELPPSLVPSASAEPSASPTFNAELLDRRWTVLFVGTDVTEERESRGEAANTDALMLVSLSADQSELTLVSLPRDTVDVPLPDGGIWDRKINGLYLAEGLEALIGAMETLYGVPIDAHLVLDMDDFRSIVDAVGGIEVSPDEPIRDPLANNIDIPAGPQEIDGTTALGYVRSRIDQDYGRMARQQEVMLALVDKLTDPETDVDVEAAIEGLDSLDTDLPLDELPTLLELLRRSREADVTELVIEPPLITFEGDRGDGRGYILEPDVEAIRARVQELIGE